MWQHVRLSEQIRPRDTLACCWDVKQPSNQPTSKRPRWSGWKVGGLKMREMRGWLPGRVMQVRRYPAYPAGSCKSDGTLPTRPGHASQTVPCLPGRVMQVRRYPAYPAGSCKSDGTLPTRLGHASQTVPGRVMQVRRYPAGGLPS